MAEFTPFHGLRYNTEKVNLADVLAPPYDVIKGDMRQKLASRNEYNVVGVELPEGEGDARYEEAARLLQEWKSRHILVRDDPAYYVYEQEFEVPGAVGGESVTRKRRGVLGALTLEEFGQGVQPHEHTLSGPKQDRLQLLRATRTNTSPIFGLFEDKEGWVESVLNAVCVEHPLSEATDNDGIIHRLWRLTDDESVNAIEAAFEQETILIADGHHRYETALNYRNEQMAARRQAGQDWTGAELENAVMMMCVSMSDAGLVVLPTHRVVRGAGDVDFSRLIEDLKTHFDVERLSTQHDTGKAAADLMRRVNETQGPDGNLPRIGMHLNYSSGTGESYVLTLRPGNHHLRDMDTNRSAAYNGLDVTLLHRLIMENQLGIGAEALAAGGRVTYTIDPAEAMKPSPGEATAAFLLRSTPVQQVREVAAAGDKMPQKSTYFYPKLVTGLVLRPLD